MNWKKGFRRIAFVSAVFSTIICAELFIGVTLSTHNAAQFHLQWQKDNLREKLGLSEDISISRENKFYNKKLKEALEEEQRLIAKKNGNFHRRIFSSLALDNEMLTNFQDGFLVNLSKGGLIGLCVAAGLVGGTIGFVFVWLIYLLLGWLVLSFCTDKPKNDLKNKQANR